MADIFELEAVDAVFKIGGTEYKLCDPVFAKKLDVLKGFEALKDTTATSTDEKYAELVKEHELEKKYIKCYLPDVPDNVLDGLGESSVHHLFSTLTKLAGEKFGANIRKIDAEKKPLATSEAAP